MELPAELSSSGLERLLMVWDLLCRVCSSDVFQNATKLGTFPAILVTYTASALLHVSVLMLRDAGEDQAAAEDSFLSPLRG